MRQKKETYRILIIGAFLGALLIPSLLVANGQAALVALDWGTESTPDFSHWEANSFVENTVESLWGDSDLWRSSHTGGSSSNEGISNYIFSEPQARVEIYLRLFVDYSSMSSLGYWEIALLDTEGTEYLIQGYTGGDCIGDNGIRSCIAFSAGAGGSLGNNSIQDTQVWHTLRVKIDTNSRSAMYWDNAEELDFLVRGVELASMQVAVRSCSIYFDYWKLTGDAHQPTSSNEGPKESNGWIIGGTISILVVIGIVMARKLRKDAPLPGPEKIGVDHSDSYRSELVGSTTIQKFPMTCPMCGLPVDQGNQFCAECGFKLSGN